MKKTIVLLMLILFSLSLFSCNKKQKEKVTVIVPNGIPYIAIGNLIDDPSFEITPVMGATNLQSALAGGTYDIVIAPINLGCKLISAKKANYKLASPITFNNFFIASNNEISSISDLEDKSLIAFGEAGIPGAVIKKLYEKYSLDVSKIDFSLSTSAEVLAKYTLDGGNGYYLLSEPELSKLSNAKSLNLAGLLDKNIIQAAVFVKNDADKDSIDRALKLIKNNINSLNSNVSGYVDSIIKKDKTFEGYGKELLVKALPSCDIKYYLDKSEVNYILELLGVGEFSDENYY